MTEIDENSERWLIAMHEAGHIVGALAGDLIITRAEISRGWWGRENGVVSVKWPTRTNRSYEMLAAAQAVFHLAGPAVTSRMGGRLPSGCDDVPSAREQLRDAQTTVAQAERAAEVLVKREWCRIDAIARVLYSKGRWSW